MTVRDNSGRRTWELRGKNIVLVAMTDDIVIELEYDESNDKEYPAACDKPCGVEDRRLDFAMDALKESQ